jgi:DNA adenine methylase
MKEVRKKEGASDANRSEKRNLPAIYLDEFKLEHPPVALPRQSRRRRNLFGWYGGKFNHLD